MKLALMQPYFFPYIGYYQLAHSVDEFIIYDNAAFIKQGYINRNSILLDREKFNFSLPVKSISSFRTISQHYYTDTLRTFSKQLHSAYSKAPNFKIIIDLIDNIIFDENLNVAIKNTRTLIDVFSFLGINKKFSFASDIKIDDEIRGQDRVIAICLAKEARQYHNSIGGKSLYDKTSFERAGIKLKFLRSSPFKYHQGFSGDFKPQLSMIDILMWCDKDQIKTLINGYNLE